jgi:class 3 adenylate cyclase/dihydrofolate reductase
VSSKRRLIVSEFVTLDGVMEAPGFEEHPTGRNGWALRVTGADIEAYNSDLLAEADGLLLGRTTYQIWAAFWPTIQGNEMGDRINAMPKYVVSRTLRSVDWTNSHLIVDDPWQAIEELKDQGGGSLLVNGSADLLDGLLKHNLVDELHLLVFPVVIGSGKRLFREDVDVGHFQLIDTRTFGSGVVALTYVPRREVPTSDFAERYVWTDEQVESLHAAQDVDRVLATIMFTDIVDSTARAAELGDRPWRRLLDRHDDAARTEVERWHGRVVKMTGDGVLATFDAPTRALRCAFALRNSLGRAGLDIRAAIHTGEVELRDADVGGIGVHIASRALAEAKPRAVIVTRTVRDLATGTDLTFTPLGGVGLRGVPGQWELFEASIVRG